MSCPINISLYSSPVQPFFTSPIKKNIFFRFLLLAAPQLTEPRPIPHQHPQTAAGLGTRLHSAPCLLEFVSGGARQKVKKQHSDPMGIPSPGLMTLRPLHSSPRLSELIQRSPLPTILGSPSRVGQISREKPSAERKLKEST